MNKAGLLFLALALTPGCSQRKPAVEPTCCGSEEAYPAPDSEEPTDCTRFASEDDAKTQFEEGKHLVEACGETCMKGEEGGKDRSRGFELLKLAASSGHLEAQSLYGSTLLGDLMTAGSEAELADNYVEALYFLALAAKRGDPSARDNLPQLVELHVEVTGDFNEPLLEPLSGLEEQWVKDAVRRAQKDIACFKE